MKIYAVGGSVRDKLMGVPNRDFDYIVQGVSENELLLYGYEKVGKSFPVFLHPETADEYSLVEDLKTDLLRRDLTINAMAIDMENNELVDFFNGKEDLRNKVLRHTDNETFKEDPVRVLRLARFLTRYGSKGFHVAEETKQLCKNMVEKGLLDNLIPERVWFEFEKVFLEKNPPSVFFNFLNEVGALDKILPEVSVMKDIPQNEKYHPEICCYIHTMMTVNKAHEIANKQNLPDKDKIAVIFSALLHDLGKGITPKEMWPRHHMHEKNGVPLVKGVCERLKVPNDVQKLSETVCLNHLNVHQAKQLNPKTLVRWYEEMRYKNNPSFFKNVLICCQADSQGRLTFENTPYPQKDYLIDFFEAVKNIDISYIVEKNQDGEKIKNAIYRRRLSVMKKFKEEYDFDKEKPSVKLSIN